MRPLPSSAVNARLAPQAQPATAEGFWEASYAACGREGGALLVNCRPELVVFLFQISHFSGLIRLLPLSNLLAERLTFQTGFSV